MPSTPDPVHLAGELADAITRLPEQLSVLFKKGTSAEKRLESISEACLKIRIGMQFVTNFIERNQPHLLVSHLHRTESFLASVERCAVREDSNETSKKNAELIVVADLVAKWLRGWAEELRTNQGQAPKSESSAPRDTPTPTGDENKQKGPALSLNDIPSLDKTNGEWVKQDDAAAIVAKDVQTLANDRLERLGGLKFEEGLSGIDRRGRMWRKERLTDQIIWYLKSSLSSKPT